MNISHSDQESFAKAGIKTKQNKTTTITTTKKNHRWLQQTPEKFHGVVQSQTVNRPSPTGERTGREPYCKVHPISGSRLGIIHSQYVCKSQPGPRRKIPLSRLGEETYILLNKKCKRDAEDSNIHPGYNTLETGFSVRQWFSKCGLWTSSKNISWDIAKNTNSRTPPQTHESGTLGVWGQ